MKTLHSWLKSILSAAMLALLASCISYTPTDRSVGNMSVEQAKKELTWKNERIGIRSMHSADGYSHGITRSRVTSSMWIFTNDMGIDTAVRFNKITDISLENNMVWLRGTDEVFSVYELPIATPFVNALYILKQNAINPRNDNEYDTRFVALLADYRNKISSNAALSEDANRYKVQAEGAVRDKQFDDAADLYAKALQVAPWWPVGHFNRALVLGEIGDYGEAKREMKRYLQLVPDAPNARAAQDKIYDWERLDSKK